MGELRRLNILRENISDIIPEAVDIPTLVPETKLKLWMDGDEKPYYKLQAINYPIVANGVNYKESFFAEFISKLNSRPIPGSKTGHSMTWGERPPTDFLLVGGKLQKNGDGSGTVFFKNYIPPVGASGPNDVFIRENKSDMVHFSVVAYTKDEIIQDDTGITVNVIGSIKGERNDAVEYGLGAMEQKTNVEDKPAVGGIKNILGEVYMDPEKKKELMKTLIGLKVNGEITLPDIADGMGLKHQIVTEEHAVAVKVVNTLKEIGVTTIDQVKAMQKQIADGAAEVRGATITKMFGGEKNANGTDNLLRKYICSQIKDESGDALTARLNALKEDPIAKKFAAEQADHTSDANVVRSEPGTTGATVTGVRVDKM
jgi:hypothetical protein